MRFVWLLIPSLWILARPQNTIELMMPIILKFQTKVESRALETRVAPPRKTTNHFAFGNRIMKKVFVTFTNISKNVQ